MVFICAVFEQLTFSLWREESHVSQLVSNFLLISYHRFHIYNIRSMLKQTLAYTYMRINNFLCQLLIIEWFDICKSI